MAVYHDFISGEGVCIESSSTLRPRSIWGEYPCGEDQITNTDPYATVDGDCIVLPEGCWADDPEWLRPCEESDFALCCAGTWTQEQLTVCGG